MTDALIADAVHVPRQIARRFRGDRDELVSVGQYALVLAAHRFDPSRGVPFALFARCAVKGAMLSEIRRKRKCQFVDVAERRADDQLSIEGRLIARETFRQLSPKDRVIVRRRVSGESLKTIGARFRRSEAWACVRLAQIRTQLREVAVTQPQMRG